MLPKLKNLSVSGYECFDLVSFVAVIQWLNKQVNEVQLSGTRTGMNELGHHINGTTAAVNFRNHSAVSVPVVSSC